MAITHPDLASEYKGDPTQIIAGTHRRLEWQCSVCGNEWGANGSDRAAGKGCPSCSKTGYDPSKIGYIYILHYSDQIQDWIKCGITNHPEKRVMELKRSAENFNIDVIELDIFRFDDGAIPRNCERELLDMKEIRFESDYDMSGKREFFEYGALESIREFIGKW